MERKRPVETESSVLTEEDTETPISMEENDEVRKLLVKSVHKDVSVE